MSELRALVQAADMAAARGERCALATVVSVDGSSYRRPGARMLVREGGTCVGTISAGCLERDVAEHARRVVQSSVPMLLEYETASVDNELAWGLGIGCGGVVRVLVEPLDASSSLLATLKRAHDERADAPPVVVATVYDCGEPGGAARWPRARVETGARLFVEANGTTRHERMAGDVAHAIAREVAVIGRSGGAIDVRVDDPCGTSLGVLVEEILPPVPLVVFGAGPDVVPLVERARELGWRTEVVDPRANHASRLRFGMADRVTLAHPDDARAQVTITPRTMAVVMSHDYAHDLASLRVLLASPARYVGVVGATHRTRRMLGELGVDDGDTRLHAPAGLDIGAEGPVEIALSIVAEMRAVLGDRGGAKLRERAGHIHARPSGHDARSFAQVER